MRDIGFLNKDLNLLGFLQTNSYELTDGVMEPLIVSVRGLVTVAIKKGKLSLLTCMPMQYVTSFNHENMFE